jgi:hypothetical protein
VDVRILDRREDALGRVAVEARVQRRDDPLEAGERLVAQREPAVGADPDLDALDDPERLQLLVQRVDLGPLLLGTALA